MFKLSEEAKDNLIRDTYRINYATARKRLAKDIMERLKYKRKEVRNAIQNQTKDN